MDKSLPIICGMLQSPDGMRRCAAAMVLGELKPKDAQAVKALGAALTDANQLLTRYVLEAFEAIGTRAVVPFVLPLLDSGDVETKLRAARIVARVGGDMVGDLARQFAKASPEQKRVLVDILARIHDRQALQLILDTLFDADFELVGETCQAVRRHITDATPKERAAMHKQVVKFIASARVRKDERVTMHALLLVGYIGAPDARRILLKYTQPRNPSFIRRNAMVGLKSQEFTGAVVNQTAREMFKYLNEPDYANIVQPALDIIEKLPLSKAYDAQWRKLLQNQHANVRAYAARRLAATDNAATNRILMQLLAHEDVQISEIAAGALARHKGSTKLLLDALARERKSEPAWRLAKILKPHSESVDRKSVKKFVALTGRDLEAGQPRHEALLYFLRNIDPKLADNVLRETGLRLKKQKKYAKAVDCLKQLVRSDGFDNELRFELSICNLKESPQDVAPHLRVEDHALRGFQVLLQEKGFRLLDRLKKEKALDADDLYYTGFHFSEGTGEELRFGQQLLEHVAKRWPRGKEAKAARNKLKIIQQRSPAGSTAPG